MKKDLEVIIRNDLRDLCSETFDYVLYANAAPEMKRIFSFFAVWIVYVLLIVFGVLPFSWYLLLTTILLAYLTYHFFYDKTYIAKYGKHLYLHVFTLIGKDIKEEVLLRSVSIDNLRSGEYHMSIAVPLEGTTKYYLLEPKFAKKGVAQQAANMKLLEADINKKKKR